MQPRSARPLSYLTRREALRLAALGGAAALLPGPRARAQASAPATQPARDARQGQGYYRFRVGAIEALLVSDGAFPLAAHPTLGVNATQEQVREALAREFIPIERTTGQVNVLLLRHNGRTVLIDTGCGTLFGPSTGFVRQNLLNAGIAPESVDTVAITHCHPDHQGGLFVAEGKPAFPNARIVFTKAESEFWLSGKPDLSRSAAPDDMKQGMAAGAAATLEAAQPYAELVEPGAKLAEGIEIVAAPGHTPGHFAVRVRSEGAQLLYITDAVHHYATALAHPEWHVAFDVDPVEASRTRRAILAQAADEQLLISGAHLPFPGVGHVRAAGSGFAWVPAFWQW